MNDYCVLVKDGRAEAYRLIEGKPEPIHFRGETCVEAAKLWPVFMDKIEYSDEEAIALLVLSDDESFVVDPAFTIAEQFSCTNDELSQIVSALNYPDIIVRSYPSVDLRSAIKRQQISDVSSDRTPSTLDENSLQGFFFRKTQEYRRG